MTETKPLFISPDFDIEAEAAALLAQVWPGMGAWRQPTVYRLGMSYPTDPYHYQRVRWAVIGIQMEFIIQNYLSKPAAPLDGGWGGLTDKACKRFQAHRGLKPDGIFGPISAQALFRPVFEKHERLARVPDRLGMAMCRLESLLDPGAEGRLDPADRGIAQENRIHRPAVTDKMAFSDPRGGIVRACDALAEARILMGTLAPQGSLEAFLWDCAIAEHNHPRGARALARGTVPKTEQEIADRARVLNYIEVVRNSSKILLDSLGPAA